MSTSALRGGRSGERPRRVSNAAIANKPRRRTVTTAVAHFPSKSCRCASRRGGTSENISGTIVFTKLPRRKHLAVEIHMAGFRPNSTHAMHIHEYGDTRNGATSLGDHYDPHSTNRSHGHHAGDLLFNITADARGRVDIDYIDKRLTTIDEILGRSVVVHAGVDDKGHGGNPESLINGNSGARIAYAIIGVACPEI